MSEWTDKIEQNRERLAGIGFNAQSLHETWKFRVTPDESDVSPEHSM